MSENVVWNSTLDGRYTLTVVRISPYRAVLSIHDGDQSLHRESVGLAYDALFGRDVDDVDRWQQTAVEFVDKLGLSTDSEAKITLEVGVQMGFGSSNHYFSRSECSVVSAEVMKGLKSN